jgi:hypothetical protein
MKHSFHPLAAVLLMCAGIGSGCAEEGAGGQRKSEPDHYGNIDAAFLSGGGFKSGPESYAAQREGAKADLPENGAHFTSTEYLFLTGAAFYSGPEGYPFSW